MSALLDLKKGLKTGELASLYVFFGEEKYLLEFYLKELARVLVPAGTEPFNLTRFDGKMDIVDLRRALDSAPFMSERRLIVARDVDMYKSGLRDDLEVLFNEGYTGCTLVFAYDALEYKPDARTKFHKAFARLGAAVQFEAQSAEDLVPWLKRRFAALNRRIDSETARYLLFVCGHLMTSLIGETEKIAAFATVEDITRRHIDAVAIPTTEAAVFDLTDAVAGRKFADARDILRRFLDMREEPIKLLGLIGKQLRAMYVGKLALAQSPGTAKNTVMRVMKYKNTYPAEKVLRAAKAADLQWCRAAVLACAKADSDLKMSRPGVLERLLLELAAC
ncbi:DNA polymerase III subunit delta [Clostridia bacterium]|nr:DNA polymerase III subunit delta [Clostridia bacterium]